MKIVGLISSLVTFYVADAQQTLFHVIHTPHQKMGIRFEGQNQIHALNNSLSDSLVYEGQFDMMGRYQYVVLDSTNKLIDSEPFFRTRSSLYEFYGRAVTQRQDVHRLSPVDYGSNNTYYKKAVSRNQVHPMSEIPTFHVHLDPDDYKQLHDKILEEPVLTVNLTRITSDRIEHYHQLEFALGGQTSKLFRKLSYSMNLAQGESIDGFQRFKIRSCVTDPSFLREKMYYDMLEAADIPTSQASFIRLFINDEPQGLYSLVDHYKGPFLKNMFGQGHADYQAGTLIQGQMQENPLAKGILASGANLEYHGSAVQDYYEGKTSAYKMLPKKNATDADDFEVLVSLIDFVHQDKTGMDQEAVLASWNKRLDVSLFLRNMAFEILLGHVDGYMGAAHNYMIYQDPDQDGRLVWLSTDLDQTMGSTLRERRTTVTTRFQQLDRFGVFDRIQKRPLVAALFQLPVVQQEFSQILTDFNTAFFQSNAVYDHLVYMKTWIGQDVGWDQSLDRYRVDHFKDKQVYQEELNQRVLQLPLGHDFMSRIEDKSIDFETAIQGNIEGHPSITSLYHWFSETSRYLQAYLEEQ